jgi:hypothetical protein
VPGSRRRCDGEAGGDRGVLQALVPGDQRGLIAEAQGACKVHGVVATKVVLGRQVTRSAREGVIDADYECGGVKRLEFSLGRPVRGRREAAGSMSSCQGRSGFGVGQNTDSRRMARVPQPDGDLGPILLYEELDQRRGIEVEGQRR